MDSEVHKCIATKTAQRPEPIHFLYNIFMGNETYYVREMNKPAKNETHCVVRGKFYNVTGDIKNHEIAVSKKYCRKYLIKAK